MKEALQTAWNYLFDAGVATLNQLVILLGPLILLAVIMNFISLKNETLGYRLFGQKGYLYIFGWLGTAVHELGHAIFALLFAHKVSEIKLFTPNSGKSLGHVKHSYQKGNPYQTLGNFFIGLGPVLLGIFLLWVLAILIFNLNFLNISHKYEMIFRPGLFKSLDTFKNAVVNTGTGVWQSLKLILTGPQTTWWKLVLFFYLFYAIGSSVTLSSSDIKGASRGFLYFVILLLVFNLCTNWIGNFTTSFFYQANLYLSGFYFLFILNICLNIGFIFVLVLLNFIKSLLPVKSSSRKQKK